jgi:hypothetical protein
MRLFQIVTVLFAWLAVFQCPACPQGYESPESLVKRARSILEVEVLSITNAPFPSTNGMPSMLLDELQFHDERTNAQAAVRVVKSIKGSAKATKFNLIGGPYDTCAPGFNYIHFKTGERLCLILDHELPAEVEGVVVNWRGRILSAEGKENEMKALIENAKRAWQKQVDFHKSVALEAYGRAEAISSGFGNLKPGINLSKEPYPVMACLRVLWINPDSLPPLALSSVKKQQWAKNSGQFLMGAGEDPLAGHLVDRVYHTGQNGNDPIPNNLADVLEKKLNSRPKEVVAFNREVFQKFLVAELCLTEEQASTITQSLGKTKAFSRTGFNPYKCEVREAAELKGLDYALGLADDEPDRLVWSTFGLRRSSGRGIDPAYLANYVARNLERDYTQWVRLVVLLAAPDSKTVPVVQKCFEKEKNYYRIDAYLAYFLKLQEYSQAQKLLDKFGKLAGDDLKLAGSEKDKRNVRESLAYCVKKYRPLFTEYKCTNAGLLEKLGQLEQQLAK